MPQQLQISIPHHTCSKYWELLAVMKVVMMQMLPQRQLLLNRKPLSANKKKRSVDKRRRKREPKIRKEQLRSKEKNKNASA